MNILEVEALAVAVGGQTLLQQVSFSLAAGGSMAVAGPSGCGKSTLLRALCLLTPPTGGRVRFAGQELFSYPPSQLRRRLGYVPQKAVLFGATVEEDLAYPFAVARSAVDKGRVRALLAAVGLGLRVLEARPATLSGGEAQRVALVRSLLARPEVLLLDESTSALDAQATGQVEELLLRLCREEGLTLLWVSHQKEQLRRVARLVLALEAGRQVYWGPAVAPGGPL